MQTVTVTAAETGSDLEAHLGNFGEIPLLSAAQERDADVRKWAAVQACLRLLVADRWGRELLGEFCDYCLSSPPNPETFHPRSGYFQLRKDIAHLLPGKPGARVIENLICQLRSGESAAHLMKTIRAADWSATLVVGLAVLELRHLGVSFRDTMADVLLAWKSQWRTRLRPPNADLARDLAHSVQRYLDNRDTLILHNVRLVYKIARDNGHRPIPLRDMVQEGCAGLARAAEKYDYRLGYRFSTYAFNWINQHIQRFGMGNGSLITYPAHVHQEINQLHKVRMQQLENTGIDPDHDELASIAGLSPDKVRRLRSLNNITVSLDQTVSDATELTWAHTLADPAAEDAAKEVDDMLLARLMEARLGDLEEMERRVVRGRFGLQGLEPMTFKQLAEQLGISTEWARQLEKAALSKLRDDDCLAEAHQFS